MAELLVLDGGGAVAQGTGKMAQSITTTGDWLVSALVINPIYSDSGGTCSCEIFADSGTVPTGSALYTATPQTVGNAGGATEETFPFDDVLLLDATKYWFVWEVSGQAVYLLGALTTYPDGNQAYDSGGGWSPSTYDVGDMKVLGDLYVVSFTSVKDGEWNDGDTWGYPASAGDLYPSKDSDTATITHTVTYSISADVELGQIDINSGGTLSFNPSADTYMEIENNTFIYVNDAGLLTMGTSATPIHKDYTAELTFNCSADNAGGVFTNNTGSMYACGDLDYFGADKETFLAYDCTGSTSITATEDMSSKWNIGDDILLSERALYTNWTLQGALTTITGFDGNIIHCADAISSAIVSGGIIAHLTRNVQIYKKGYVKAWYNINATGRPYIEFDEVTSTKWFSAVEFGGLSRLQNLYMNMPNFPSPDGLIEWCTFRNGSIALYYNYGARVDNCIFHSLNQTIHTGGNNYFSNIIFLACNYGIYASMVNSYAENIYGSNCGTIVQYPRSCKIVGLRSYGCYSDLGAGTNVTIIDSYLCGLNAGCPGSENMDFYNCSFGIDIDGKVITNNYNMQFSVGDYRYYNCKVEPSLSGKYRANNAAYARTYHRWENYNQVEGDHRLYSNFGDAFKIDADGSGDNPTQRGSGNSTIFEVQTESLCDKIYDYQYVAVIDQQIYVQADIQRTIRYYIQTDYTNGLSSDAIWLEAHYNTTSIQSINSVIIRSNQSDWSQYVEITVNPTQDGWLRIKLIVNDYESGKYIWIDPKPEVV